MSVEYIEVAYELALAALERKYNIAVLDGMFNESADAKDGWRPLTREMRADLERFIEANHAHED